MERDRAVQLKLKDFILEYQIMAFILEYRKLRKELKILEDRMNIFLETDNKISATGNPNRCTRNT